MTTRPSSSTRSASLDTPLIIADRHRSETNGIAERAVRPVTEGTRSVLVQSGLHEELWWPDAIRCYCFLRCVIDKIDSDNKTPYERRFGVIYDGPAYPFGCEVEYMPSSKKYEDRLFKYGRQHLPGILVGYDQKAGGHSVAIL